MPLSSMPLIPSDDGISGIGIILKFADDTKLMDKVGKVYEIEQLRGDLAMCLILRVANGFQCRQVQGITFWS